MEKQIVVLYSTEQKCFHVEYLTEYIGANIQSMLKGTHSQFRLVSFASSFGDANLIIEKMRKTLPNG